jgi:hypothetical protein
MESFLQLYQLAMVVLPVYGFVSLRKQIRRGELSRKRAALRYAAMIFAPMPAFAAVYMLAVGAESVLAVNLISEEIARTFPLAIALGLSVWLLSVVVFVIGLYFVKSVPASVLPKQ